MRSFQRHCLRWLLLVAAVVGQERMAEATCGDYLEKQGDQAVRHSRNMSQADSMPATRQPPHDPVCLGPNCRRHDPIPAPPSNEIVPSTVMKAILAPAPLIVPLQQSDSDRAIQIAAISGPAGRIFRPPRMV